MPQATAGTMFTLDFCLAGGTVVAVLVAVVGCRGQSVHIRNKLPAAYRRSSAGGSRRQLRLYVNQALHRDKFRTRIYWLMVFSNQNRNVKL